MKETTFILTEDHIKLIRNMYVGWSDSEYGAPEIDPKRPYGNSYVEGDIHEILAGENVDYDELPDELCDKYRKLHEETQTALQIILMTGKFEAGVYERSKNYSRDWKLL